MQVSPLVSLTFTTRPIVSVDPAGSVPASVTALPMAPPHRSYVEMISSITASHGVTTGENPRVNGSDVPSARLTSWIAVRNPRRRAPYAAIVIPCQLV